MHVFSDPTHGDLVVERHLLQGRNFDVVRARTADDRAVIARAARFEDLSGSGAETNAAQWTEAVEREVEMAASACPNLPSNPMLWRLPDTDVPVVVYDFVEGKRLDAWVADRGHDQVTDLEILTLARGIAVALADLHGRGFVHRNPGPEHVIVRPDGTPVLIGLANGSTKGGPACLAKSTVDDAYSAPEIQRELSGQFNTPRSDVYAFGMLLSFMATGERPTGDVGSPITRTAWDRLSARAEGISLVIAKCTQPLQKNRFPSMEKLIKFLEMDALPTPRTEGFGPLALLAPWGRGEPDSLRVGHLSPGPLVDRPREGAQAETPAPTAALSDTDVPAAGAETAVADAPEQPWKAVKPAGYVPTETKKMSEPIPWIRWTISAIIIVLVLYVAVVTASR